jgi:ABC-type lipoprotein export system ATPase subunit
MGALYKISGLKCSYNQGKRIVLEIDELEIPAGKIVFIIGMSGIGKSTILETLGMMNNTIFRPESSGFVFYDPATHDEINLAALWKQNDTIISGFRNKHFSFIFQNTNLMYNLTAYENIYITQLIQGKPLQEVKSRTKEILRIIGLDDIKEKQYVSSLSVGQKQRLAFARAIVTDFTVLFCDEPTGNLDMNNAYNLMDILQRNIYEHNRTAIIVTHDIDLAIKYADTIINIIQVHKEIFNLTGASELEPLGTITDHSVFRKENPDNWINRNERYTDEEIKKKLIKDLHYISKPG